MRSFNKDRAAFMRGYYDYEAGKIRLACPYKEDRDLIKSWEMGFDNAEEHVPLGVHLAAQKERYDNRVRLERLYRIKYFFQNG
jgi:ribosome modulation factor